eukprot:453002-Hanusia_phi.AAC.1
MLEKLNEVYDNTKGNKEQSIQCSSEVFLRLNLSLDGIQELAKSARSFEEFEEKVTREWELACKQQALGQRGRKCGGRWPRRFLEGGRARSWQLIRNQGGGKQLEVLPGTRSSSRLRRAGRVPRRVGGADRLAVQA